MPINRVFAITRSERYLQVLFNTYSTFVLLLTKTLEAIAFVGVGDRFPGAFLFWNSVMHPVPSKIPFLYAKILVSSFILATTFVPME